MQNPNPSPNPEVREGDPYAALRFRDYRLYTIGWFVAMMGTRIQSVAIGWETYQRTEDALALGLIGLVVAVPTIALALPAGFLADRFERKKLIVLSLAANMLTALGLAAVSLLHGPLVMVYALLFLDAVAGILGRPARSAVVPLLVPKTVFPNAVTWNTSLSQLSSVLGPAIGGLVVATAVSMAYFLAAAGALCFAAIMFFVHIPASTRLMQSASWDGFLAGLRYVRKQNLILTTITLDLFAVLLGGAVYLLPIYAQEILHVGAWGFGILRTAPAWGAMIMAFTMLYLPPIKRAGRVLLLSVAGFGVATIVFGFSTSFWLSFLMLALTGAFDNVSMVIRQTLEQLLTPDEMRGRVSAVTTVFVSASNEIGGLESGTVAHWFGAVFSVVSGGIGTLVVVAATAVASPELRNFGALTDAKPLEEPTKPQVQADDVAALPAGMISAPVGED